MNYFKRDLNPTKTFSYQCVECGHAFNEDVTNCGECDSKDLMDLEAAVEDDEVLEFTSYGNTQFVQRFNDTLGMELITTDEW